jgi:chromosome segregation ATPase
MAAEFATRAELQELERRIETRLQLVEHMDERFDAVDRRLDRIDQRFDTVDQRFEAVDRRFEAVDDRFNIVERQLRGLRSWGAVAFLILLLLQVFVAWRIGL